MVFVLLVQSHRNCACSSPVIEQTLCTNNNQIKSKIGGMWGRKLCIYKYKKRTTKLLGSSSHARKREHTGLQPLQISVEGFEFAYRSFQKPVDPLWHSTISGLHSSFFCVKGHLSDRPIKHCLQQRRPMVLQSQQAGEFHACHAAEGVFRSGLE